MTHPRRIEIPFGVSYDGDTVSIPLTASNRNHCFISGAPGSGKSTLLKVMIESIAGSSGQSPAVVWTDYFSVNHEKIRHDRILDVHLPMDLHPEERMRALSERLYEEAQNRIRILARENAPSYRSVASMPMIIAVIDDLSSFDRSDSRDTAADRLLSVLRMSHAIGISLICSSQLPVSSVRGITPAIADLFNIRISLRAPYAYILEALDFHRSEATAEEIEAMKRLSSGYPGDFVCHNRYHAGSFAAGHVKP